MSNDPYSARVRELFAAPTNAGRIADAPLVRVEAQGVRIVLSAVTEDGVLKSMRFEAWGCPHVIAAAQESCTRAEGNPAAELLDFSVADLMQSLSVPVEKTGRILVIEDAVRALGRVVRETSNSEE